MIVIMLLEMTLLMIMTKNCGTCSKYDNIFKTESDLTLHIEKLWKTLKASATTAVVTINAAVDCRNQNYIYLINCRKCRMQYVGKSTVEFSTRMGQHRRDIINQNLHKAVGEHFNRKGHKVSDFECSILEKVLDPDPMLLSVREQYWIRKFNVKYKGINLNQC